MANSGHRAKGATKIPKRPASHFTRGSVWRRYSASPVAEPNAKISKVLEAEEASEWLMRDPGSPFTNALAVLRVTPPNGYVALQNDRLRTVTPNSVSERPITSADHLADTLETVFDPDIPRPGQVWDKIQAIGCDKAA